MKKSLTAIAVAALISAPVLVQADEGPTVFGTVHMAVEKTGKDELILNGGQPRGNQIGARGNYDTNLMGMKSIYQMTIGLDTETGPFYIRDTWVGLSSKEYGTVRAGAMDTHYKDTAKPMDPFLSTSLEGRKTGTGMRGVARNAGLNIMSKMHAGANDDGSLQYHTIRYDSPAISGVKVSAVYGLAENDANNIAVGADYNEGPIFAFIDFATYGNYGPADATATKIGGKYTMGDMSIGAQYEIDGGAISGVKDGTQDMIFVAGTYTMGATTLAITVGNAAETVSDAKNGNTSFAIGVKQALAKKTTAYAGFGMVMNDDNAKINNVDVKGDEASMFTVGMIQVF